MLKDGKVTALAEAGAAYGINNADVVVGSEFGYPGPNPVRVVMYKSSRTIDLGTLPGHTSSVAYAVNDRGQVVGISASTLDNFCYEPRTPYYSRKIDDARAFLYTQGKGMVNLSTLRTTDAYSAAFAINKCGQVVGFSGRGQDTDSNSTTGLSAFLYARGRMVDLNSRVFNRSAFRLAVASGINGHGQIVGHGSINGQLHAFLLTPRSRNMDCGTGWRHS